MTAHPLLDIQQRIRAAALRAGRSPDDVTLVGASKSQPLERLRAAYDAGLRDFGENYAQELLQKMDDLPMPDLRWHFIGHLQRNKARFIAESPVACFHALDSPRLARTLARRRRNGPHADSPLDVLIAVNVAGEDSKSGVEPDALPDLARATLEHPELRLRGLMTLPPWADDPEDARPWFRALRNALEDLQHELQRPDIDQLSMGMSNDFEVAVEEGATCVRVGSALFGARA